MPSNEEAFRKHLLQTFRIEAAEHIHNMVSMLFDLEKDDAPEKRQVLIETLFREVHSLKGAARAVDVSSIEGVCQSVESVLAAVKRAEMALSPPVLDVLNQATHELETLYSLNDFGQSDETRPQILQLKRQLDQLQKHPQQASGALSRASSPEPPLPPVPPLPPTPPAREKTATPPEKATLAGTIRIASNKLDALLLQAEELVSARLVAGQLAGDLQRAQTAFHRWNRKTGQPGDSSSPALPRPDAVAGTMNEASDFLADFDSLLRQLALSAICHHHALSQMVNHLLEESKRAAMQSFSSLLDLFPRLVRELARDQEKQAELILRGTDIEVDRRILEAMKDPLIHAIRNCIDHGIESPQARIQAGKPSTGQITIAVSPKGSSKVEVLIADDGAGIDPDEVRDHAVKAGLLSPAQAKAMNDEEAVALIFESGVTTNPVITEISGRGLGLAILREKAEKLGGEIGVETRRHAGTTLRIVLPHALATFRGVLMQCDDRWFIFPSLHTERVLRIRRAEIKTVENRETIELDRKAVSLVRLGEVLKLPQAAVTSCQDNFLFIVLVRFADTRIGFAVDRIDSEQEFLVKSLGPQLVKVPNIAGVTVLGNGRLVPILDVADLMQSASMGNPGPGGMARLLRHARRSILVVEDSITTRTLLKNLLEANGWSVRTAVDGIEALDMLQSGVCDLVVSDVDMPRMNGFELTARIRANPVLAELPVVLVTSLDSRDDQERGMEAGANAYIVKSRFDHGKLIEVIKSLM